MLDGLQYGTNLIEEPDATRSKCMRKIFHKATFRTHEGSYEFLLMPLGLNNATIIIQSIMIEIFKLYLRKFVIAFFDDILVYSTSLKSHITNLTKVFNILSIKTFYLKK